LSHKASRDPAGLMFEMPQFGQQVIVQPWCIGQVAQDGCFDGSYSKPQ
jgi:hypothetical protein